VVVVNRMRWGQTVIPNAFIDRYLAAANGEYVKVYLLLLRLMDESSLSVANLADRLELTEKDVIRALNYWEKVGLIRLSFADSQLQQMTILELPEEKNETVAQDGVSIVFDHMTDETGVAVSKTGSEAQDADPSDVSAGGLEESLKKERSADQPTLEQLPPEKKTEFKQLIFVSEQYLGRTLTRKDLELFSRMYLDYRFSSDLIEYLVEYCVDNGHKTVKYMEAVADGWNADEIRTVQQAKAQSQAFRDSRKKAEAERPAAGRKMQAVNRFHNYVQRTTDYNAILQEEARKNGADE